MADDLRKIIWEKTYYTYYKAYYYEYVSTRIIRKWQVTHDFSRVIIAITASGTGISGWALWKNSIGAVAWAMIAGLAALCTVIYAAWDVSNKIKEWSEVRNDCINLRIDLEIFRDRMLLDKNFDIKNFQQYLIDFKKKYGEIRKRIKPDIYLTRGVNRRSQKYVNEAVKQYTK